MDPIQLISDQDKCLSCMEKTVLSVGENNKSTLILNIKYLKEVRFSAFVVKEHPIRASKTRDTL